MDINARDIERHFTMVERFVYWMRHHINHRQGQLILALIVGMLSAVAAYVLHSLIRQIEHLLTSYFNPETFNLLYLVFPVVGIYLTSLFVRFVVKDNISHGITRILAAISEKQSRLKRHNCWSSVIASAITIGFGGSVGAEAPIVLTCSSIGSNLGQLFRMDNKTLMLLVGCGAAGAIAGIFKAPIAGLMFTIEVLLIDLTMTSLLPIMISSVTATCFTYIFMGQDTLFSFTLDGPWQIERVPATILLGVFCGLVSLYFIRTMTACEDMFARYANKPYVKLAIGGSILSVLIFLFPALYGEGYSSMDVLLNGRTASDWEPLLDRSIFYGHDNLLIAYVAFVCFTKVFATSATNGGGGCGGTFAPSLFIGCFAGFLFARIWNIYELGVYVPEKNFALLGMAGVMSGVMHAPLTAMFLIAELTTGYSLFIPLIIVSASAYLVIVIFEPHSIYGMRLAKQGKLITHHTDHAVLTLMNLESVIDKDYTSVKPDMKLGVLVSNIARSKTEFIPVVNDAGIFLGIVDIINIRQVMFRIELYQRFTVGQLMEQPKAIINEKDDMETVMNKFETSREHILPVVDGSGMLQGIVSRERIYSLYRKMVADRSDE